MVRLQEIRVDGQVCPTHAKLTLTYRFQTSAEAGMAQFLFPFPMDGTLVGFSILTPEKTLIRGRLSALADEVWQEEGCRLIRQDNGVCRLEWLSLPSMGENALILDCLLRMRPMGEKLRFFLPMGLPAREGGNSLSVSAPLTAELVLDGVTPVGGEGESVLLLSAEAGKDLVADFRILKKSLCLREEEWGSGVGFYRLYASQKESFGMEKRKARLRLLLEFCRTHAEANRIKELAFRSAEVLSRFGEVYLEAPEAAPIRILQGEEDFQALYLWLQEVPVGAAAQGELSLQESEVGFYLSSNLPIGVGIPMTGFHWLTSGDFCPFIMTEKEGRHFHFYPDDSLEEILPDLLPTLLVKAGEEGVMAEDGSVTEMICMDSTSFAVEGYRDVVLTYQGRAPRRFSIWKDGTNPELCVVEEGTILPRFPEVGQLFAMGKTAALYALEERAGLISIPSVKTELEAVALRYRIMNSEVLWAIPTEIGKVGVFWRMVASHTDMGQRETRTIFGDSLREILPEKREKLCLECREILRRSLRRDGSIYSADCPIAEREEETALAYLALLADGQSSALVNEMWKKRGNGFLQRCLKVILAGEQDGAWRENLPLTEELLDHWEKGERTVRIAASLLLRWSK